MSYYERQQFIKQETQEMGFLKISLLLLFAAVFFCSFAVPSLKTQFGQSLFMETIQK